jgi:uncharacterized protein YgbK (DUF1537 family)
MRIRMNAMDRPIRPAPPKPTARKASAVNTEFEDRAKRLLRSAIEAKGVRVEELTARLAAIGVEMSKGGVANKISRGGFSSAFLLECLDALELELKLEPKVATFAP